MSKEIISTTMENRLWNEEDKELEEINETQNENNIYSRKLHDDFDQNVIESLEKELKIQDEKNEKAMKNIYRIIFIIIYIY